MSIGTLARRTTAEERLLSCNSFNEAARRCVKTLGEAVVGKVSSIRGSCHGDRAQEAGDIETTMSPWKVRCTGHAMTALRLGQ